MSCKKKVSVKDVVWYHYKCKADCLQDIIDSIKYTGNTGGDIVCYTIVNKTLENDRNPNNHIPDCIFDFFCNISIYELKKIWENYEGISTMYNSLNFFETSDEDSE